VEIYRVVAKNGREILITKENRREFLRNPKMFIEKELVTNSVVKCKCGK
jgi:hypothetical protein